MKKLISFFTTLIIIATIQAETVHPLPIIVENPWLDYMRAVMGGTKNYRRLIKPTSVYRDGRFYLTTMDQCDGGGICTYRTYTLGDDLFYTYEGDVKEKAMQDLTDSDFRINLFSPEVNGYNSGNKLLIVTNDSHRSIQASRMVVLVNDGECEVDHPIGELEHVPQLYYGQWEFEVPQDCDVKNASIYFLEDDVVFNWKAA